MEDPAITRLLWHKLMVEPTGQQNLPAPREHLLMQTLLFPRFLNLQVSLNCIAACLQSLQSWGGWTGSGSGLGFESSRFGAWKCRVWNFVVWGLIKCQSGVGSIIRLYKAEGIRHLDLTVWTVHQKEDWSEQL